MTDRPPCPSRRTFLLGVSAAALLPGSLLIPAAGADPGPALSVSREGGARAVTVAAVEALGGMETFVPRGASVLLKPNIGWDRTPEQGANTHPEVVRALAEMCLEAGASSVLILDRTCNDARRTYVTSGMTAMVAGLGDARVRLEHVRENRFVVTDFPRGGLVPRWPLYQEALRADVLINVPVAKHHSISGLTLGMKNLMGLLGGNRGKFHSGIGDKLAELTAALPPALTVLDATRILLRNGPSGGRLEDVKRLDMVAASSDPVAIDAFGATLFGREPEEITSVAAGYRLGLGEMNLARVMMMEASP